METIQQTASLPNVRASVNERKFFSSMKHLFTSSRTVLTELMQNARRAGASKVIFDLDVSSRTITVSDDGIGIQNFATLLALADSGWSEEQIIQNEKPFGMGFFSVWHACKQVTVYSNGFKLQASIEDIMECRPLNVVRDATAESLLTIGIKTQIILRGVNEQLLKPTPSDGTRDDAAYQEFKVHMQRVACGFAIPVFIGEYEVPRPFALENLNAQHTDIGDVSIRGIHYGQNDGIHLHRHGDNCIFLQGLPIGEGYRPNIVEGAAFVLHLDSQKFTARMPDRSALFDADNANQRIMLDLRGLIAQFLEAQKQSLEPKAFVEKHWRNCSNFNVMYLLDDVPFVPRHHFSTCTEVSQDYGNTFSSWMSAHQSSDLVSKEDVQQYVKDHGPIVINVPSTPNDTGLADDATILKVLKRKQLLCMSGTSVSSGHWLQAMTVDLEDEATEVKVEVIEPHESSEFEWTDEDLVRIKRAKAVTVTLSLYGRAPSTIVDHITDDWVYEAHAAAERDSVYTCWHCGDNDDDDACAVFQSFTNDDRYDEKAEDSARLGWRKSLAILFQSGLSEIIGEAVKRDYPQLAPINMDQLALVVPKHFFNERNANRTYGFTTETIAVDTDLITKICAQLSKGQGIDVSADQLAEAIAKTIKPGMCTEGPKAGTYAFNGKTYQDA